jgi:hypothetical protein
MQASKRPRVKDPGLEPEDRVDPDPAWDMRQRGIVDFGLENPRDIAQMSLRDG